MALGDGLRELGERIVRKDEMAHRGRMLALQITLDRGAAMVASLSVEKWSQWTVYFVGVVDGLLGQRKILGEEREEFLHRVAAAIADRLGSEGW